MDIYVLDLMGSNRTFMELKSFKTLGVLQVSTVLIVPLWN